MKFGIIRRPRPVLDRPPAESCKQLPAAVPEIARLCARMEQMRVSSDRGWLRRGAARGRFWRFCRRVGWAQRGGGGCLAGSGTARCLAYGSVCVATYPNYRIHSAPPTDYYGFCCSVSPPVTERSCVNSRTLLRRRSHIDKNRRENSPAKICQT